jgi:tetratricopeptide (TPR) repeat protein
MSKRQRAARRDNSERDHHPREHGPAEAPARRVPRWVLVCGLLLALAGVSWWGLREHRKTTARRAVAALQPVAHQVPADPPERRAALEIADRLLQDYPHSPEALYARGSILSRYGFNDEAVATWEACLQLMPDLAPVYELLGVDALRRGESERAVALLRKAVELDPESRAAGLCLGEVLNSLGRMEEAIPVLNQFLQTAPDSADAYFQLGQAHLYLQDYARAKAAHASALKEDPQYAQACYGLAVASGRLGETDQSQQYRERYVQMIAQSRLVEHRRVRQNRDEAELQQALARAYVTAGSIYLDHGRTREAQEFWNKAVAIDPQLPLPDAATGDAGRR